MSTHEITPEVMKEYNGLVDFRTLFITRHLTRKRFYNVTIDDLAGHGLLDIILRFPNKRCSDRVMVAAVVGGNLDLVKYLHSIGKSFPPAAVDSAISCGSPEMVKYLYSLNVPLISEQMVWNYRTKDYQKHNSIGQIIWNRHLEVFQFLHSVGAFTGTDYFVVDAVSNLIHLGRVEIIKYLYSIGWRPKSDNVQESSCLNQSIIVAARSGYVDVIKFLHSIGIKMTVDVMDGAISYGQFEVVEFLHSVGVKFTPAAVHIAIADNKIKMVKYVHGFKGCYVKRAFTKKTANKAAKYGRYRLLRYLYRSGLTCSAVAAVKVAGYGNLKILRYLHKMGVVISDECMYAAASEGYLKVVKFIHSIGVKYDSRAFTYAVVYGYLHVVEFLYSETLSEQTLNTSMEMAIGGGHCEVAQFLFKRGVKPRGESKAVENGHLRVVKFLHKAGVVFDNAAVAVAVANGYVEVVKFLHSVGVDCSRVAPQIGNCRRWGLRYEVVKFLYSIGDKCTDRRHLEWAVSEDSMEKVKLFTEMGLHSKPLTLECKSLEVAQFLHSLGVKFTEDDLKTAVQNGRIEVVQFLYSVGVRCPGWWELAELGGFYDIADWIKTL